MGVVYQVTNLILSFVSRTVFIKTLGDEYLGLNGIFSDVLMLLSMADLGFSTAMAYSFYKPLADKDEDKLKSLVAFYKKIYNVIALVVLCLGLLCIPFLRFIVNTEKEIDHLEIYYLFSLANVVASYLFVYKTTLLTADQKDYKVVKVRMFTNFTKVLLQIFALIIWKNYIIYLAIGTVLNITNNLIASKKAEKEYPYIKNLRTQKGVDKGLKDSIVDNIKSVFIYKVSTTIFSSTDNIIISIVINTIMVGLYSNYLMLSQKLLLVEQIVFSAMTASIGNVIASEKAEKRYSVFQSIQSLSFIFCGIITTGYCILADDLVRIWLGESHRLPLLLVVAVSLNTFLACALQPLWSYRDASGLYRKTRYIMLIATIENIVLSVVLGKLIGVAGIIFATAIARLTTYFWYEPKLLYREYFERSPRSYFIDMLKNLLLSAAVILVVGVVASRFYVDSWGTFIIKAAIVGIICTAVFVGVYYKTEGAQNLIRKVKELVRKKCRN
jgi:O-antigen/teichoic acid export membrane protein